VLSLYANDGSCNDDSYNCISNETLGNTEPTLTITRNRVGKRPPSGRPSLVYYLRAPQPGKRFQTRRPLASLHVDPRAPLHGDPWTESTGVIPATTARSAQVRLGCRSDTDKHESRIPLGDSGNNIGCREDVKGRCSKTKGYHVKGSKSASMQQKNACTQRNIELGAAEIIHSVRLRDWG
jgi:hypothetical protein